MKTTQKNGGSKTKSIDRPSSTGDPTERPPHSVHTIVPSQDIVDPLTIAGPELDSLDTARDSDGSFNNREIEVFAESIEGAVAHNSLVRQLLETVRERITFFRSAAGGALSLEQARARALKKCVDDHEAQKLFDWILREPADTISFYELARLWDRDSEAAEKVWKLIKKEAENEFKSGHLASRAVFPTRDIREAWVTAKFLAIRDSIYEEWQPRGGTEIALIDMLVQCYIQWNYWLEQVTLRSQTSPRTETFEYREWKRQQSSEIAKSWEDGKWFPQYVDEQTALETATQMADRWQRMYLRSLRHLRDLRRYNSVTIRNAKQVNIASDHAQQSNHVG